MHYLLEHINQDIKRRLSKDKGSTVNKPVQEIPQVQTAYNPVDREEEPLNHHENQEDRLSKAISCLFLIKMIAILEWT